jgi:ubiquinone biosynthesis protein
VIAQTVLITLAIVVFAAWMVRRLLGIRSGRWLATVAAVFIGQTITVGVLLLVHGQVIDLPWPWYPVGCALVVVMSMIALASFELAGRGRERTRSFHIPRPITALRGRFRRARRYVQVTLIATRNGLLRTLGDDPETRGAALGRSLAATFEEAGGLFVKLGQAMASQPQLVTPQVAAGLARLQDRAAQSDPAAALAVLHEEIGSVDDAFAEFAPEPVAMASIGQTYFATLRDGQQVVVKVQRPGVREAMERDLDIVLRLARRLQRRAAWAKAIGLLDLVEGFAESTREELDFRIEATNCRDTQQLIGDDDRITVPGIVDEFTTRRVLVQERVDGRSVGAPGVLAGLTLAERRDLGDSLVSLIARQMLNGGRFHADPHPGNVFLRSDGQLALIDFGSVGRLNRFERLGLLDLFRGLQNEDPALMRQAALRLGTPSGRLDTEALDRELARLLTRAILPGGRLDPSAVGDLVVVARDYGIRLPRSITALFRTLATLMGTLDVLVPEFDLVGSLRRLGGQVSLSLGQHKTAREFVQQEVLTLAPILSRLPGDIDELVRSLLRGDVRTRVSLLSEPEDVRVLWQMVNRALVGALGAAILLTSALLLTVQVPSQEGEVLNLIGGVGLAFGAMLLLRTVIQALRQPA